MSQEVISRATPTLNKYRAISPKKLPISWKKSSKPTAKDFEKKWDDIKVFIEYWYDFGRKIL